MSARSGLRTAGGLVTLLIGSACFSSQALACNRWELPRTFDVLQTNGYRVWFWVKGRDEQNRVWGKAAYRTTRRVVEAGFKGGLNPRQFWLRVRWGEGGGSGVGVYSAVIPPTGFVTDGFTYESTYSAARSNWKGIVPLRCLDQPFTVPNY